jgi:DNA adenine methylase
MLCYATIRHDVAAVMALLDELHARYMAAPEEERKRMFYAIRQQFNDAHAHIDRTTFNQGWVERSAQMIFLNRTCFNGLFRFNARGHFNVPFGKYKNPRFYDAANLRTAASILQHTTILCGDFTVCQQYADEHSFFYLDPPYRPLSKTAGFTSYARFKFDDADQQRLARFFAELDALGAKLMLSNSDPKNANPDDDFFERLYARYKTATVQASRAINSDSKKRGKISELVITNY